MSVKKVRCGTSIKAAAPPYGGRAKGFTLLEVLIALLVLSVGLVGVAALSVQSVQNVHSSLQSSIATAAALDFEERLWLELGRASGGCPDPGTIEANSRTIKANFRDAWDPERRLEQDSDDANWLGLPLFDVTGIPDDLTDGVLEFVLAWREERFTTLGDDQERFAFRIEILCRLPPST